MTNKEAYKSAIEEIYKALKTGPDGLSEAEAKRRLTEFGPNVLKETAPKNLWRMILGQFSDFMIIVLIAAAIVSGLIGEMKDAIAIIVIVILNAVIGFVQEYRAERAMEALKKMATPLVSVKRNGQIITIPAENIVPGDLVLLEAGNIVPADMRIISSHQLKIDEAALTGESIPVDKITKAIPDAALPLGDRRNMAYKATTITYGRGEGIVAATGMNTEIGKIATLLQEGVEVKTPLQKRLTVFGKNLALAAIAICVIIFVAGILRGEKIVLMFLTAVSLAVAAIPEALPAVITISLALGAAKMVKKNTLIRKLPAVETLGSVTYICSDKTGTLTLNQMVVERYCCGDSEIPVKQIGEGVVPRKLLQAMALNNDARTIQNGSLIGDPTEIALLVAAEKAGFKREHLEKDLSRVAEIPFDPERKCMTTIHRRLDSKGFLAITKGSLETILDKSIGIVTSSGHEDLDKEHLIKISEQMAADGLRILAFGIREWDVMPKDLRPETVENNLLFLGLVGLIDPPREEAKESISLCKSAGIKPVMITGDHPITATTIARRLGILDGRGEVITGEQLENLSMEEFEDRVGNIRVYARVVPEQKLKIVRALQDKGEFVAMTGDGVNDAPALKRADIGVAMGITGTDVAKESSHMILLDDNFATIVRAVREGRKIYDNIRKFVKYTMTSNSGEIWTIFLAPFLGLPIPLLPIHILWINLVTDGLPGLALAAEPEEKGIMQRPPRHPKESIFAHGMAMHIIWVGLLMGGVSILTQAWAYTTGHAHWQTMVFTVLCLSQMGHALAVRSETESLFTLGALSNLPLLGAVLLTLGLQLGTIYIPPLQGIFKTQALSLPELIASLLLSSVVFWAVEIEKRYKRQNPKKYEAYKA